MTEQAVEVETEAEAESVKTAVRQPRVKTSKVTAKVRVAMAH